MSFRHHRWIWVLLVAAVSSSWISGCSNDDTTGPSADGDVRIGRVEVDQTVLGQGDETEIRVWVVRGAEDGTPVEGAAVRFSEQLSTNSGSFSKTEELTDAQGRATTKFTAAEGTDGLVTLKIKVGEDVEYALLQVSSSPSNGVGIAFSTSGGATSLAADGQASLQVTVTLTRGTPPVPMANTKITIVSGDQFIDIDGNGVWSDGDQLVPTGDLNGDDDWTPEGQVPAELTTDLNGQAIFLYKAGTNEGNVYVKATAAGATKDLTLLQHSTSLQVGVEAAERELLANGVHATAVTASVSDFVGMPIEGVVVRFVAGEVFTDVDGDGYYTLGVDSYEDVNENGKWDAIGTIQSVATTGGDGTATVPYTAGVVEGPVSIRATTSNGGASSVVNLVRVQPAVELELSMTPTILPADGISISRGTVVATDVNGETIVGKKIRLVAGERFDDIDGDGLFTPGTDVILDDADGDGAWTSMGGIPAEVFADGEAVARFGLVAGLEPGTIWVRASADGISVERSIELQNLPTAWSMQLSSVEEKLAVRGSGGVDNSVLTATAFDSQGEPVPAGVEVVFRVLSGPGGGELIQGAEGGEYATRTDVDGRATAVLSSGTSPGLITVEATSGSTARRVEVPVGAGPAAQISGRALDSQIDFWSETTIEAVVQDAFGNPVEDGTLVIFSVDEGLIQSPHGPGLSETTGGIASATYKSLGPSADSDFVADVSARVDNTPATTTFQIQLISPSSADVEVIQIASSEGEISTQGAGGTEEALISVSAFDGQGRRVGSGYPITFEIVAGPDGGESLNGGGWGPVTVDTNAEGTATAILRSGTMAGPVVIEASGGLAQTKTIQIGMASGAIAAVECVVADEELAPNETTTISAFVYDDAHNAVPDGTVVWFSADEGLIDGAQGGGTSVTVDGRAEALYTATTNPGGDGLAEITCEVSGGISCTTYITVDRPSGAIYRIELTAERPEIGVQGTGAVEQTKILARGTDEYGNPVGAGLPVTFAITQGPEGGEHFLSGDGPVTLQTGPNGVASATVASGTVSGTLVIEASAGPGISNHTTVAVAAGPPYFVDIGVEQCNVLACGRVNVENNVVAVASDIHHNPVRDGTVIWFTTDKGVVHGNVGLGTGTTINGVSSGTWRSAESCEFVEVSASTAGGTVEDQTIFIASDDPYQVEILSPSTETVSVLADGQSDFIIWAEVLDINGMFVLPTQLDWDTEFGTINDEESGDGCGASVARALYTSATLDRDYSVTTPDDGIGAVDVVSVSSGYGGVGDVLNVNLLTSGAFGENCEIELGGSVGVGGSVTFQVSIQDRFGNPLGGHTLTASVSAGSVSTLPPTDQWGTSTGTFTAPAVEGPVSLSVLDTDPGYGGVVLSATVNVTP